VTGNDKDPPTLFAGFKGTSALVPDTVELHRREAQMATVATAADEAGHSDASEARPQAIVCGQQWLRDGLNGPRALRRQVHEGLINFVLGGTQPFERATLALRELCKLAVQRGQLGIEGLALFHKPEGLVLELRGTLFQAFDVFCHGLQLA
jgi:hypothetical protein